MKVLFFAQVREITGRDHHVLKVEQAITEAELWSLLSRDFPALASQQKGVRLARNETYLQGEMLNPGDEIALIPPVSGG
jgi:molybdopterin synthase sulfur carrier subunit